MKDFFKNKSFKVLVAVIFILTGVLIIKIYDTGNVTESIISFVMTPMQKITTSASDAANNLVSKEKSSEEYEKEIESLKDEINNLRKLLIDYSNIKTENEQYSQYLKLKKNNESLEFAPAEVIGRDPSENFFGFMIDQGSNSGISVHDPVITSNGIVGYVSEISATSSHVKTLLSPETKIGAINKFTRDSGVVSGNIKLADENLTRLSYISSQSVMSVGDIVVTSGLGGIYPRDLPIGKVKELLNDEYDSSRYALIEPFEDVRAVRDVFVVIGFSGQGEIVKESLSEIFKDGDSQNNQISEESK